MRWCLGMLALGFLLLGGCGGGGGSAPTAGASGAPSGPPAAPGGAPPAPPGADGGSGSAPSPPPGDTQPAPMSDPSGTADGQPPRETPPPSSPDGGGNVAGGFSGFGGFGGFGGESPEGGLAGGLPPLSAFSQPRQKPLRVQAIDAYRAGNEAAGAQLLMTHFAVAPGAEKELAAKMAWIPGLRRPAFGPRFGVAVYYEKPPRDFEGSPMPIGSSELAAAVGSAQQAQQQAQPQGNQGTQRKNQFNRNLPTGNVGGKMAGRKAAIAKLQSGKRPGPAAGAAAATPENAAAGTPEGDFFFETGELGHKLLEALDAKIEGGEYGPMYKDIVDAVARPAQPDDPNNPGADPNNPGGDGGGVGAVPGGGQPVPGGDGHEAAAAADGAQPLSLAVVWLGKLANKDEALHAAEAAHVDYLITYELSQMAKANNGTNLVRQTTTIRINPVKKGEPQLFASKGINNLAVHLERDSKKAKVEDPVEKEVERAMEALDKVCKAAPLPALTPEVVKNRLAGLIAEKPSDPLPVVVEARLYVAKGLLPEADMQAAAVSLLGEAEYARLIAKSPGSGMGQLIGNALSLPGMVNLVQGTNAITGAGKARRPNAQAAMPPGADGQPQPRPRSGLRGLLPF